MYEDPRDALKRLAKEQGESLAGLSRMIGRGAVYLQQYVMRGTPKTLAENDRKRLADFFGVDERLLGAPEPQEAAARIVAVPRLSVEASAGTGSNVDGEFVIGSYKFDQRWLRAICSGTPAELSIIRVKGDSMAPTLMDGDDIIVDRADAGTRTRDGIYVLRRDETLMVKRVSLAPTSGTLAITSDNPAYPSWRDVPLADVDLLGRVVWTGRRLA